MKARSKFVSSVRPFTYPGAETVLHCENAPLDSIVRKFGTPLYVYSSGQILSRYRLFSQAFASRPHMICYSVKANSNLSILRLLARQGSGFDIVSGGELERVLTVSKKAATRAVFSGVGKTAAEMDLALKAGILIFNVEGEAEVELLAERAAKLRRTARISLRVNPDISAETHPYISTGLREHKFGLDIRLARSVYAKVKSERYLDPVGVSVHIGSQIRDAEPFRAATRRLVKLIRELKGDGVRIQFVDAGGGLGIDYMTPVSGQAPISGEKRPVFDPENELRRYAAGIDRALGDLSVQLLLEPGRFLTAQAGSLLARVLYVKKNGSKTFVITDAGMNDLIRPSLYQAYHEVVPVKLAPEAARVTVDVVGPVCESGDFFARDRMMPAVQPGDLLAILDTGAYGMSLSSNYNSRPRPAEVMVTGSRVSLIRRRETQRSLYAEELHL